MKCKNCGSVVQDQAKFCTKCGSKIEQPCMVNNGFSHNISYIWPEWQIEKQIGKGSYGVVYQAVRRDNNVESHAAIKVISIPSDSSELDSLRSEGLDMDGTKTYFKGIVDDFVSEIRLMESLKGIQNIVSVEDYKVVEKKDTIGWDIYIRMELLTPFNTYICDKNLTEYEIIKLGCDICTALEICGQRNIIHRDIKPENIFVNDFGYFKLGDFGIARKLENMTGGLSQKGTFNYIAPEVVNSSEYDARVDTYSLGIVLYRLLNNNKLPFLNTDKQLLNPHERKNAVERRIRGEALPAPCNASPAMANLILRACAHNPNTRFASATEMKQALMSVANGTYAMIDTGVDKMISVSSSQVNNDPATAVVKATVTEEQKVQPMLNTIADEPRKKKNKGKKAKIIAVSVLVCILALAIALVSLFFTSSAYSVYKDMVSENYKSALRDYKLDVKDDFMQETILDMLLDGRVEEVVAEYENGDKVYETAVEELITLDEMGFEGAKEKIAEITSSNDAENALEKADEYYEKGDYENAISEYSKVPETNKNYKEAQNKLTQVYADYISSTVETAKKHNSSKNYKQAVQVVNTAYDILPDSVDTTDLDTVKEESLVAYQSQIMNEVNLLTEDSQYVKAFDKIDEALAVENNDYFNNLKTSTEKKYVNSITTSVQKYLDKEDYISSARIVSNALSILPDNSELLSLKNKVETLTPTYLLDVCKPYQSSEYTEYINGEKFTVGGVETTNGFQLCAAGSYAIFNVDKNYTSLSFLLGHVANTYTHSVNVKVYLDGVLSKTYTVTCDDLAKREKVDITGVSQIKIQVECAGDNTGSAYSFYGFGNVTVK